jgi:mannose-6-phosphate isomerase
MPRMKIYPLKFRPIFKERIWGGQKLKDFFNKPLPPGTKIGESWELADLPDDKSVIVNGPLAGQTLPQVIAQDPKGITGISNFSGPFPLLIKLLDAQDVLSVQVHPDLAACKRMGTGDPKTECWYIIAAEPGSVIYKGLKPGVTRDDMAAAIKNGTVADLLVRVPVQPGECHFLPSGTVHAIGSGLLIAEIQQPSDTTYRVFDWNRVDDSGKPRKLHINEALESIHYDSSGDDLSVKMVGRLVDCPFFKVDKGHQAARLETLLSPGKVKALVITTGAGKIIPKDKDLEHVNFASGDTLLIPADFEGAMRFTAESEYLIIFSEL